MINFLKPYKEYYRGIEDTLYYNIVDRKTGIEAYVFSEYNALFENNEHKIIGKCFYLHIPTADMNPIQFKKKIISGKPFFNLGYTISGNGYDVNPDVKIKKFISQYHISSNLVSENIFANSYSCFDEECVVGVSEPKTALRCLYYENAEIKKVVDGIVSNFGVCIDDLGITGSLALGGDGVSDYDIIFYGNIRKLNEIKSKIDCFKRKYGSIIEYGLNWPCRFYDDNHNLICCFFVCTDYSYNILKNAELLCDNRKFDLRVIDDTYSILKTPILDTYDNYISSIVILNSGFKGVFQIGDRIQGTGKVIKCNNFGKDYYYMLIVNPFEEITNYQFYFNRDI